MLDQIKKIDGWQNKTATELHAALAAVSDVKKSEAEATLNGNQLQKILGVTVANALVRAIEQALPLTAWQLATDRGTNFADDVTLATLRQLPQQFPDFASCVDALIGLGVSKKTYWEQLGGAGSVPSVDAIQTAMTIDSMRTWLESERVRLLAKIETGEVTTAEQAVAVFGQPDSEPQPE